MAFDSRIQHIQRQLHDTTALMQRNLIRVTERGHTTHVLEEKAESLEETSYLFVIQVVPWYSAIAMRMKRAGHCLCLPVSYCSRWCHNWCTKGEETPRPKIMDV